MKASPFPLLPKISFACVLLLISIGALTPTPAQDLDNVSITGRVVDQNGAIIPGASMTAILGKTGLGRTVKIDSEGRYSIRQLEPGIYTLRISATSFEQQERQK